MRAAEIITEESVLDIPTQSDMPKVNITICSEQTYKIILHK